MVWHGDGASLHQNGPCFESTSFSAACTLSTKFHLEWYSAKDTCVALRSCKNFSNLRRHILTRGLDGISDGPLSTMNDISAFNFSFVGFLNKESREGSVSNKKISLRHLNTVSGS